MYPPDVCFLLLYKGSYFKVISEKNWIVFIFGACSVFEFDVLYDVFNQLLECGACLLAE